MLKNILKPEVVPSDDDEEIFFCEKTRKVFLSYDDYFEHLMLLNARVWQCQFSLERNLTYDEAAESEKRAKWMIRHFPTNLKSVAILIAMNMKLSSMDELTKTVYYILKTRFFIGDELLHKTSFDKNPCKVVAIVKPKDYNPEKIYDADELKYMVVTAADPSKETVARGAELSRSRKHLSMEQVRLFLTNNVELLRKKLVVKAESVKTYVYEQKRKYKTTFIGQLPNAEVFEKIEMANQQLHQDREDLQLIDQRPLPPSRPVKMTVDNRLFGEMMKVLEFMHTFDEILETPENCCPKDITFEAFHKCLIIREIDGLLSQILQCLVKTIFALVDDESKRMEYRGSSDSLYEHPYYSAMQAAASTQMWVQNHFFQKIDQLSVDANTVSEVIRLHLLGSGALLSMNAAEILAEFRNDFTICEDPGLYFAVKHSDILENLKTCSIYELPTEDVLNIMSCLIDQIMTFAKAREFIEKGMEQQNEAKIEIQNIKRLEKIRKLSVALIKNEIHKEYQKQLIEEEIPEELLATNRELRLAKLHLDSAKGRREYKQNLMAQATKFFNQVSFLGSDRAHRNYFVFKSAPGLFVEHNPKNVGTCLTKFVQNYPELANARSNDRSEIIKKIALAYDEKSLNDEKMDINGNAVQDDGSLRQSELLMCNCDPNTCVVHSKSIERVTWSFYTADDIDELLKALNLRGHREKILYNKLKEARKMLVTLIRDCPMTKPMEIIDIEAAVERDVSEMSENALRETILNFEKEICDWRIGKIKLTKHSKNLWRTTIANGGYCLCATNLTYGTYNYIVDENTFDAKTSVDEMTAEGQKQFKVYQLALALVQLRQGVKTKLIGPPFMPATSYKDKNARNRACERAEKKLSKWEDSLVRSTSFSQVFLHYITLFDAINWSDTVNNIYCTICRLDSDPDKTLLCDKCNKGWHTFCVKLSEIPTGDWFCPRCRSSDYKRSSKSARKKRVLCDSTDLDDDDEDYKEESLEEDYCEKCGCSGDLISCISCSKKTHAQCAKPPIKALRVINWRCKDCFNI